MAKMEGGDAFSAHDSTARRDVHFNCRPQGKTYLIEYSARSTKELITGRRRMIYFPYRVRERTK